MGRKKHEATATRLDGVQRVQIGVRFGGTKLTADVAVTGWGLLAIGAIVSGTLLSTAVIVQTARSNRRRLPEAGDGRLLDARVSPAPRSLPRPRSEP